ncbi:MAG: hypothetical protein ABW167_02595 [Baekduia sp.]
MSARPISSRRGRDLLVSLLLALAVAASSAGTAHAAFGIVDGSFAAEARDGAGNILTQAGARPDASTSFELVRKIDWRSGDFIPDEWLKDAVVDLPPGVVGNPTTMLECDPVAFSHGDGDHPNCPAGAVVGVTTSSAMSGGAITSFKSPLWNLTPEDGTVAQFGFAIERTRVILTARLRSDSDYGVSVVARNTPAGVGVINTKVTVWGVPADPSHNADREYLFASEPHGDLPTTPRLPFFTSPTGCDTIPVTRIAVSSWQHPDVFTHALAESPQGTGCDLLDFAPTLKSVPTTGRPDTPSGLGVDLDLPQNQNPDGLATAHLKTAVVKLPEGMTINPSSADGLDACTDAQVAFKTDLPVTCPAASKIGSVTAQTPVLTEPITGSLYVRSQNSDDPQSGEMFRVALVLSNKKRGLLVKLPGSVRVDPLTGRVETEFADNPQLPVSHIRITIGGGDRAPLATPQSCQAASTDATLSSWAGHEIHRSDPSAFDCSFLKAFAPGFQAGAIVPRGGAASPLQVHIDRPDGQPSIDGVTLSMPTGALAKLKGVPVCDDARANAGTCDITSRVGSATVGAGAGTPFILRNQPVYLAGPYKGAPYSLSVAARAKAGPFDLGEVVVRQAIFVDPIDAHVTVVSDPLPTIVKGVPLRIRSIDVDVDRPGVTINPTSCAPKAIDGSLHAMTGATAAVSARYQVGDCSLLDVKPKLGLTLSGKGQTTDGKHPAVTAVLTQPAGGANLKRVRVALPLSLALDPDNAESSGLCTFVEGSKPDPKCPASSVVGKATAISPILNQPLSGPVYFVKNERKDPKSGRSIKTLPKLVIPLVGENGIKLTLTGTSDVVGDQLVTTFNNIPDAPVSSFRMDITGGKKGILVVSDADICKAAQIADQQVDGQNNKTADADVSIQTPSCPTKILSTKVGKSSVSIKVGGLGAGKVTVTGKGIRKTTKTISKSTVATITAKRTKGKPGKVKVSFLPAGTKKAKTASATPR